MTWFVGFTSIKLVCVKLNYRSYNLLLVHKLVYTFVLLNFYMKNIVLIIALFIVLITKAQMPGMMKGMKDPKIGRVYGKVLDATTGKPVEYASIQVLWFSKDSLLSGGLVKENGDFSVDGLPSFV